MGFLVKVKSQEIYGWIDKRRHCAWQMNLDEKQLQFHCSFGKARRNVYILDLMLEEKLRKKFKKKHKNIAMFLNSSPIL